RFLYLFLAIESLAIFGWLIIINYSQIFHEIHVVLFLLMLGLGLLFNTLYFNNNIKNTEINAAIISKYSGISMIILFASFLFITVGEHKYGLTVLLYILILFIAFSCMIIKKYPPK
ncbi:MAG: hypothetical protein ACI4PJ_00680, partial [Acutalibacteraceae bacterium]